MHYTDPTASLARLRTRILHSQEPRTVAVGDVVHTRPPVDGFLDTKRLILSCIEGVMLCNAVMIRYTCAIVI